MSYYKSKQHKRWREIVLRRSEYRCQMCKRKGRNVPATDAHHIWPIATHPHLRLDPSNGIGLCAACHNAIEPRTGVYEPPDWMLRRCPAGGTSRGNRVGASSGDAPPRIKDEYLHA